MPSAWNMFVKKIYHEGKKKDPNYEFKQALVDASKRKGEMGKSSSSNVSSMDTHTPSSKRSRHRNRKHTKSSKKSHTKSFLSSLISGGRRRRTRRH